VPIPTDKLFGAIDLTSAQARLLFRYVRLPDPGEQLEPGAAGLLLTADLLIKLGLKFEQVCPLMEHLSKDLLKYLSVDLTALRHQFSVQVLDNRFAVWPYSSRPFDLVDGRFITSLPALPVVSVCVSLTGLVKRLLEPLLQVA
jgi:hypothetical protein